ncbi:MAG: SGNH/GDSL hydrolase family protein [Microbacterium sp.]|uniref:SGNH/GDSL hydrolase family protein n=1 Tax=Microbacterium sp. TaxID=51671 RepID=UPI003F95EC98
MHAMTGLLYPEEPVRYVAVGDSFTEGIGDGQDPSLLGWADRVADGLRAWSSASVSYANLAIRGRTISGVLAQVSVALALRPAPTLVTICGGGNDLLRPTFTVASVVVQMRSALTSIMSTGARPVLLSPADPSAHLPLGRLVRARGHVLSEGYRSLAARLGISFVDVSHDVVLRHRAFWSDDRLHLNAEGHDRVAASVLAELIGLPVPAPASRGSVRRRLKDEVHYLQTHVAPWMQRRLTGRSSGDLRSARYPDWC